MNELVVIGVDEISTAKKHYKTVQELFIGQFKEAQCRTILSDKDHVINDKDKQIADLQNK